MSGRSEWADDEELKTPTHQAEDQLSMESPLNRSGGGEEQVVRRGLVQSDQGAVDHPSLVSDQYLDFNETQVEESEVVLAESGNVDKATEYPKDSAEDSLHEPDYQAEVEQASDWYSQLSSPLKAAFKAKINVMEPTTATSTPLGVSACSSQGPMSLMEGSTGNSTFQTPVMGGNIAAVQYMTSDSSATNSMIRQHCDMTEASLPVPALASGGGKEVEVVGGGSLVQSSPNYLNYGAMPPDFNESKMINLSPPGMTRGRGKRRGNGLKRDRSPHRLDRRGHQHHSAQGRDHGREVGNLRNWRNVSSETSGSSGTSLSSGGSSLAGSHVCTCPHVIGPVGKVLNLEKLEDYIQENTVESSDHRRHSSQNCLVVHNKWHKPSHFRGDYTKDSNKVIRDLNSFYRGTGLNAFEIILCHKLGDDRWIIKCSNLHTSSIFSQLKQKAGTRYRVAGYTIMLPLIPSDAVIMAGLKTLLSKKVLFDIRQHPDTFQPQIKRSSNSLWVDTVHPRDFFSHEIEAMDTDQLDNYAMFRSIFGPSLPSVSPEVVEINRDLDRLGQLCEDSDSGAGTGSGANGSSGTSSVRSANSEGKGEGVGVVAKRRKTGTRKDGSGQK